MGFRVSHRTKLIREIDPAWHDDLTWNDPHAYILTDCEAVLRPGSTAAVTKTITITTQRKRILLVELLHAEYAHAHSTNVMRSLCVVIFIVIVIAAVGLGLYPVSA